MQFSVVFNVRSGPGSGEKNVISIAEFMLRAQDAVDYAGFHYSPTVDQGVFARSLRCSQVGYA